MLSDTGTSSMPIMFFFPMPTSVHPFLFPSSAQLLISGFLSRLHQHSQDYRIFFPPPLHTLNSNCQSAVKDTLCFGVNEVELVKITVLKKVEYGVVFL